MTKKQFNITEQDLLDLTPEAQDLLDFIKNTVELECDRFAKQNYGHMDVRGIDCMLEPSSDNYKFRVKLGSMANGQIFKSLRNKITSIKSDKDIKDSVSEFLRAIDRGYFVR